MEFARFDELENLKSMITQINPDLIINCAGITKHNPNNNNISEVLFLNSSPIIESSGNLLLINLLIYLSKAKSMFVTGS